MDTLEIPSPDFDVELVQGGMKAAMAATGAKSRDLLMIPVDQLKIVAGLNVRIHDDEYEAHVEEVKRSILENGFYQHFPLSGYAGKEGEDTFIYVTGGFTRLEAAKRAMAEGATIEALPVVLKPPGTSMLDLTIALAQDNTGAPLHPYERAIVIKRAIGYGADEETIARKMNVSEQYVKDLLYLLGLPNTVQQMVIRRQVSAGHAIATARKHGVDATKVLQEAQATAPEPAEAHGTTNGATPPAGRVTPRQTRSTPSARTGATLPKKTIWAAIDYAIAMPDGIEFLSRWRKGEKDATKELATYMAIPKRRKRGAGKKTAAKKTSGRRPGRPKANNVAEMRQPDPNPEFDVDIL